MNNIKQITNYDVQNFSTETRTITKGEDTVVTCNYIIIPSNKLGSSTITKLGYCANNPEGKDYPIFLTINTADPDSPIEVEFQLGKTGMFEFQAEEWKDINDDNIERIADPSISKILVPSDVSFVLDYVYPVSM